MALSLCVVGESGQVAQALTAKAGDDLRIATVPRSVIDLAQTETLKERLKLVLDAGGPFDAIVNAAAYTAVDKAEEEEDIATLVNGVAPGLMAEVAADAGLPFLHISTDYVFNGEKSTPYVESDEAGPTGAYGRSKRAGEEAVARVGGRYFIGRTAWVYSVTGHNFVKTMLRLRDREKLGVVADQLGSPTCADDIASALISVARQMVKGADGGTYHMAGAGFTSWHGFAEAVFEGANRIDGGARPRVDAITSAEFPTPAKRPGNSRLDCGLLQERFGVEIPFWKESLQKTLQSLL